jgi:thiosulfate dehydrogenase
MRHLPTTILFFASACAASSEPATPGAQPAPKPAVPSASAATSTEMVLKKPDLSRIPAGPEGDLVRLGRLLSDETVTRMPDYVGDGLRCSSCHFEAGMNPNAIPWIGIAQRYPRYRSRSDSMVDLEGRIEDCFERSMAGKAPPREGQEMRALVAWMNFLSEDPGISPELMHEREPLLVDHHTPAFELADAARGETIYNQRCAACHGANGQGTPKPDGTYAFPPLWGEHSFDVGAGMARVDSAAAWVRANMPLGQGGSLSEQEAYDVALFFTHKPRPDSSPHAGDWPKGDRPRDARY